MASIVIVEGRVDMSPTELCRLTIGEVGDLDTVLMLNVIAGYDAKDATAAKTPVPDYPTAPVVASKLGETNVDIDGRQVSMWPALRLFTLPFNLSGLPACTVPCGFSSDRLPIGLQIVGKPFAEATVLRMAHAYECTTDWHRRHPE
jgi:Asp-tRNA(Asn)/Glu-tRNA(Gln) amidotransferase A subunit family amidase